MTAEPFPPPITCPSSLVASCAPLLGFVPHRCLVAFVHGAPDRVSPVILRIDLPPGEDSEQVARQTAQSIAGTGGAAVDAIAWIDDPDCTLRSQLTSARFLSALGDGLASAGIELGATFSTNGRVWWSHACLDPVCCPETATDVDSGVVDAVRAEYVFAGYAPLASRDDLAKRVARDQARAAAVRRTLDARARDRRTPDPSSRWRDAQIRFITDLILAPDSCAVAAPTLSVARTARVLLGLSDIQVRDVVLHRLVLSERACSACWSVTIDTLCQIVRAAPVGATAPVATILALVTWMRGEGTLSTLCLQRADEEPGYRLAELARQLIARGTNPRAWRASLSLLSESECRRDRAGT